MEYKTEVELLYKAKEAEGLTFGQIDKSGRITNERSKGNLGQIIEESFFGYEINSKSEADFKDLGIELKVTPIKKNKNGSISAKERLVLNIINYHEEAKRHFETSSFWRKNEKILMMFYGWNPNVQRSEYQILKSYLHTFEEADLEVIRQDWEVIINKIKQGKAHELSEADTIYLGACTKGANRSSVRSQPFSEVPAMQRAYSLKQSYMTTLARKVISDEHLVSIVSARELKSASIEELLERRFRPYIGKSLNEISYETAISINTKSKSFLQQFVSTLLGVKGTKLQDIEEFAKANIVFKTIRLEPNGLPKEHMSFKNINFDEWLDDEWDDSWLKTYFEETKFLFVVFEYKETESQNKDRKLYFKGIKLWNMPMNLIQRDLKEFWIQVKMILEQGVQLSKVPWGKSYRVSNNLPSPGYNGVCHIRPKGKDGNDKVRLPDGQWITKQAFWLDREFVAKVCASIKR